MTPKENPSRAPTETQWSLLAARLIGAGAIGALTQSIVDMPGGYFGAADEVTTVGLWYATGLVVVTAAGVVALLLRWGWSPSLVPLVLSLNVGAFLPALPSDPLVAGLVVLWSLTLLATHVLPTRAQVLPPALGGALPQSRRELPPAWRAVRHLGLLSLILTVGIVGYRLSTSRLDWAVCVVLGCATLTAALPFLRQLHRRGSRAPILVLVPVALGLIAAPFSTSAMLALLAVGQVVVLVLLVAQLETTREGLQAFYAHPSRLVVGSFTVLVLVGTLLLSLPAAATHGERIDVIDALFTAPVPCASPASSFSTLLTTSRTSVRPSSSVSSRWVGSGSWSCRRSPPWCSEGASACVASRR